MSARSRRHIVDAIGKTSVAQAPGRVSANVRGIMASRWRKRDETFIALNEKVKIYELIPFHW